MSAHTGTNNTMPSTSTAPSTCWKDTSKANSQAHDTHGHDWHTRGHTGAQGDVKAAVFHAASQATSPHTPSVGGTPSQPSTAPTVTEATTMTKMEKRGEVRLGIAPRRGGRQARNSGNTRTQRHPTRHAPTAIRRANTVTQHYKRDTVGAGHRRPTGEAKRTGLGRGRELGCGVGEGASPTKENHTSVAHADIVPAAITAARRLPPPPVVHQ